jgi:hypothetical protein
MVQPIRPEDVKKKKVEIPDYIIEAFNELIQEKWDGTRAKIEQEEAIKKILGDKVEDRHERNVIFDNHWLDVEDTYREFGWDVQYYKQPYYETKLDHFFIFKKKVGESNEEKS